MGIVSTILTRRRAIVLGGLIVLLHVLLFSLLGKVGMPHVPTVSPGMDLVQARLLPQPEAPPVTPLPLPTPKPTPPPPVPVPDPVPEDGMPPEPNEDAVGPPAEADAGAVDVPVAVNAILAQAAPAEPTNTESVVADAAPAPVPEMRRYKVDAPPPATITMDVARVDADGTRWSGEAQLGWTYRDDTYRIEFQAGIRVVFARVNLALLTSEGALAATGFAPVKMTEKRRGRAQTATHFDWQKNQMTFSASQKTYPLVAGAQDKASVPLQLAAIARGDPAQLSGDIDIQVGEDRDASVYRFVVVGPEQIDTKLGKLQVVHLSRPPKEGAYRSKLDIWLAPQRGWYPVQIRSTEANGAVTTQTVNTIALTDTGK